MEMFSIILGACVGLVAVPVYCVIVAKLVRQHRPLAAFAFWSSVAVVALYLAGLLLVKSRGIIGTYELVGPWFFGLCILLSFSVSPAIGCVCLLGRRQLWWPVVAVLCWLVGFVAVFYHIHISETLYGIDGVGGPYVQPSW